jgi:hypothetical protein
MDFGDDEYLQRLDDYLHEGVSTTLRIELTKRGFILTPSQDVSDEDLQQALTELVWAIAGERVFITAADHLPDREFYEELLKMCDDATFSVADLPDSACHWSLIDAGGDDNWSRYYADEIDRNHIAEEFPDDPLPPSELPPFPRPWIPARD